MSTTVRVEDDVKAELDRLQLVLQAEAGKRLSQSELLGRLLQFANRRESQFMTEALGGDETWVPPTPDEMDRLLSRVRDWGVATDASRIDEALYEDASPHGDDDP